MSDVDIVRGYDSASSGMRSYGRASGSLDISLGGLSPRALASLTENLRALGFDIDVQGTDTTAQIFRGLRTIIITNYSLLMLQGAYRSVVKAKLAYETAAAAAETAFWACIPVYGWARIALAAGAAFLVTATLSGWYVGEKFGSGDWNLPMGDIGSPQGRRMMEADLRGTGIGEARRRG